ncbi:hypothetical protein X735_32180 [Mesorhizobium sp. L2C085B000]|nr:hypothetical protein X735_32180 [Mesorhizobium sp. L2C085B000]
MALIRPAASLVRRLMLPVSNDTLLLVFDVAALAASSL